MADAVKLMRTCAACFVPRRSSSVESCQNGPPELTSAGSSSTPPPPNCSVKNSPPLTPSSGLRQEQQYYHQNTPMRDTLVVQPPAAAAVASVRASGRVNNKSHACAVVVVCVLLAVCALLSPTRFASACIGECPNAGGGEEDMMMRLQIEKIKHTILEKLRLERPPQVAPEKRLPEQVLRQMLAASLQQQQVAAAAAAEQDTAASNMVNDNNVDGNTIISAYEYGDTQARAPPPPLFQRRTRAPATGSRFDMSSLATPAQFLASAPANSEVGAYDDDSVSANSISEFYAKNAEILLVAENASIACPTNSHDMCIDFDAASLVSSHRWTADAIERAVLYIPVSSSSTTAGGHKIRISSLSSRHLNTEHTIGRNNENADFVPLDITEHVQYWLQTRQQHWSVYIQCETCDNAQQHGSGGGLHIASAHRSKNHHRKQHQEPLRPYISLQSRHHTSKQRERRAADCIPGMDTCCRKELSINFASIGWDQWILHPKHYQAYYCQGSCNTGIHYPQTEWTMIMQHRMNLATESSTISPPEPPLDVPLCCSPTTMSSLTLLYYDEDGTIKHAKMPNMIVQECGCS